jgi:O-antigen/teichoic acid export membrane protein
VPDSQVVESGRLLSNSVALTLGNILGRALAYAYFILLARRLDERSVGVYAILVTTLMVVDLISNLGLDKILTREIASRPAAEGMGYFRAAIPVRLTMALISAVCAWTLLRMLFRSPELANPMTVAMFLSAVFPLVLASNCESFLTAHERLVPVAVSQFVERTVIFLAVLLLSFGLLSFGGFLCVAPLAALARLAVVALAAGRLWERGHSPLHPPIRRLLSQASQMFSVEVLAQAYFRSDVFLLAKMGGLRATGVYQITYKIFDCCLSLSSGFLQAAFPRLVRDRTGKSLKSMLSWGAGTLTILAVLVIAARHILLSAIKPEYLSGSVSLTWLMLTVPLVYITTTLANAAIAAGQLKILIAVAGLLLFTNVGLNVMLIPRWSINGAAFSTFACELLSAAILGIRMRKVKAH